MFFFVEAEYVYRLHKDFVPLRLQQDYVPDGWLGIMVGTRLYFDVYSEDIIDRQIPGLVKELGVRGKISHVYDSIEQGKGTRLYFDVYSEDIIDRQIPGLTI